MEVILKQDVENLGRAGDKVEVKRGYAKNYLIPFNLAIKATPESIKQYEHEKRMEFLQQKKNERNAREIAQKINSLSLSISKQAGEDDKLFGSVSSLEIAELLKKEGFEIDRRKILLPEPIKQLGVYTIPIKIYQDITANVKLWVVKE
jgi:large subunit ribosomal protein L9